jgi:hypothetical protein
MSDVYEADFYAWTKGQADALRRRAANEIDWDNLAEEIDYLGNSHENEIEARLENLLLHLLKWNYQPESQCGSWRSSIREVRYRIARLIKKNPSLRAYPSDYLGEAYSAARPRALDETGLVALPDACPWTIDDVLAEDFLPSRLSF